MQQRDASAGLNNIPLEMRQYPNWLVWKGEQREGRMTKVPYRALGGGKASSTNPATWSTYDVALAALQTGRYNGIGFAFENTPYIGVDIDHCGQDLSSDTLHILKTLDSYTEWSQSGEGLHIIVKGKLPGNRRKSYKGSSVDVEIYGAGSPRFFALTGNLLYGEIKPVREAQEALDAVHKRYLVKPEKNILEKIRQSKQATNFDALWRGDTSAYGGDDSRADMALCNMLAFWTGKDTVQMDALFRQSGLYRPKWDEKRGLRTYGEITMQEAIDGCKEVYRENRQSSAVAKGDDALYFVSDGYLYGDRPGKTPQRLANFTAQIDKEIRKDDGEEFFIEFGISGKLCGGKALPPVSVRAEHFNGMSWATKAWGARAIMEPGTVTRDKIRHAIQVQSQDIQSETVFVHTGWRQIDGRWAYLYHGGAVGTDNVSVALSDGLQCYALPSSAEDMHKGMRAALGLLELLPRSIGLTLLAFAHLAPLREFAPIKPNFGLFACGSTGCGKTSVVALLMSFFGDFDKSHFPASFTDTANAIGEKAFLVKDMPLWVDDYHPTSNPATKRRMDDTAQRIARLYGDNNTRGRMRADGSLRPEKPARGLCVATGEQLPLVDESGLARFFLLPIERGDIPLSPEDLRNFAFTQLQNNPSALGEAMRGYIEWLIPQTGELPQKMKNLLTDYRLAAQVEIHGAHLRLGEAIAHLMSGLHFMLQFYTEKGVLSEEEASALSDEALQSLCALAKKQSEEMKNEKPSQMFASALRACVDMNRIHINNISFPDIYIGEVHAHGYHDEQYCYLNTDAVLTEIQRFYRDGGREFPLASSRMVLKHLREAGMIAQADKGKNTFSKQIGKTVRKWLCLPLNMIYGGTEE